MEKIYKFHWDCGRMGDLHGVFVADEEEINKHMGQEVYFGEVLGKYSEIVGTLTEEDLKVVTDNQEFIKLFKEYGLASGFNPLQYIEEEEIEEDEEE